MENNDKTMEKNHSASHANGGKRGFNIIELMLKLKAERKLFYKTCGIAIVVGLVVAFSIPKTYESTASLTPEYNTGGGLESKLGAIASMAGINLGAQSGEDALLPQVYPEIVASMPFLDELLQIKVRTMDGEVNTTLQDYMKNYQSTAWWNYIIRFPKLMLGKMFHKPIKMVEDTSSAPGVEKRKIFYSEEDYNQIMKLQKCIGVSLDDVLGTLNVSVTMQDPLVAQIVADSLLSSLQTYITKYRTNKAQQDLNYMSKLYDEAKEGYAKAQAEYAQYSDMNTGLVKVKYRAEEDRLQQEMNLAYQVYSQIAQQLELSKAKVQERTPVYSIIEPPVVPLLAAGPQKAFILFAFLVLAFGGTLLWVMYRDALYPMLPKRKKGKKEDEKDDNDETV